MELFEAAKNAADAAASEDGGPADESRCLDALKELKEFPVSTKILVSTQVGKRLKHLAKHPRKKIQSFAIDLIEIWKNIVLKETQAQKKNADSSSNNSVRVEPVNAESSRRAIPVTIERASRGENVRVERVEADVSPRPQKLPKTETYAGRGTIENGNSLKIEGSSSAQPVKVERLVKQESNGPAAKRSAPKGPPKLTSMVKCNDAMRDKVRELLFEALSKVYSEADDSIRAEVEACDPIRVAVSVESVMFENWGRSNGTHKFKYRSIMFNIKDPNNLDFRRRVLLGEVKPDRICNLTAYEMASTQRKLENQQIEEKKLFDCERGGPPKATTDQFKCGRCGQRKCTYYQLQTRSADEPMTTFVTCVNCNNHWKFC